MVAQRLERIEPAGLNLEERIIDIWRCAAVIKGGKRFSFAAMVVVGNGGGIVGVGYGKAREVPLAIEKAVKDARKNLVRIPVYGTTVPHEVRGRYATAEVVLIPALPGTGIIAGQVSRAILECLGIHDILTKSVGGCNNPKNLAKATLVALQSLRSREFVARLRGVEIPEDVTLAANLKVVPAKRREWGGSDRQDRGGPRGRGRPRTETGFVPPAKAPAATEPAPSAAPAAAPGEAPVAAPVEAPTGTPAPAPEIKPEGVSS